MINSTTIMKGLSLSALFLLFTISVKAQGCSDAGICTASPSMSSGGLGHAKQSPVTITYGPALGMGENGTKILENALGVTVALPYDFSANAKISHIYVDGDLGSNSGIGDLVLTLSRPIVSPWENAKLQGTLGVRLPTGSTDASDDVSGFGTLPLPMVYQTGLGTTDLLAGLSVSVSDWHFAVGLQYPVSNQNKNRFLNTLGANTALHEKTKEYFSSHTLDRKPDLMLRAERKFTFSKHSLSGGMVAFYHLGEDKIMETGQSLDGSDGLTLNLSGSWQYQLTEKIGLGVEAGAPVAVRKSRPDGLTRAFVLRPSIRVRF